MPTVTLEEAQTQLAELIDKLRPGESITIARNQTPIARLHLVEAPTDQERKLGTLKVSVLHVAPDFDAPLQDFREIIE